MDLLGGYDDSSDENDVAVPKPLPKKKVDISRLPISRPLDLGSIKTDDAPLKKQAEQEALRPSKGASMLASLPPPKVTLGSAGADAGFGGSSGSGGMRIDLSGIGKKKQMPQAAKADDVLVSVTKFVDGRLIAEADLPQAAVNHPMFGAMRAGVGQHTAAAVAVGGKIQTGQDGPSPDDLEQMRQTKGFTSITPDQLVDPNWYMNNKVSGGPGLHKGKKIALEVSNYDEDKWNETTHANPNKTQKRKHQINWLAQEAMDNEAEMLDRNTSGNLTKAQTSLKYGW